MRLKTIILPAVVALLSLTACAQQKKQDEMDKSNNNKTLVAYFSATGTTERVAKMIAEASNATLFEIKPETPYTSADLDWTDKTSRSTIEMQNPASRPAIADTVPDINNYSTVFLGFPVWWYVAPTIINTFIESNNLSGKTVVCFATSGGSPIKPCVDALAKQYPDVNWKEGKLLNSATRSQVDEWLKSLQF